MKIETDKAHVLSGDGRDLSVPDGSDPDLWPLQVLQDADRARDLQFQRAYRGMHFGVILMGAVTEVQPKGVDAGEEERFQHVRRSTGRTNCRNDFCPAIAAHGSIGLSAASGDPNGSDIADPRGTHGSLANQSSIGLKKR